jgi:hypothetical protein
MTSQGYRFLLGEWLVCRSLISRSDLFVALNHAFQCGCRLGDAVVDLGLLGRDSVEHEVVKLCTATRRAEGEPERRVFTPQEPTPIVDRASEPPGHDRCG